MKSIIESSQYSDSITLFQVVVICDVEWWGFSFSGEAYVFGTWENQGRGGRKINKIYNKNKPFYEQTVLD